MRFEAIMEGLPTKRFKRWLTALYETVTTGRRLNVQVSPEIADLFDHLLATEQEIPYGSAVVVERRDPLALRPLKGVKDLADCRDWAH